MTVNSALSGFDAACGAYPGRLRPDDDFHH